MLEFYQAVQEADMSRRNMAATVTEGDFSGEKFLLSDQKIIWQSKQCGPDFQEELEHITDSGVYTAGSSKVFCELLGGEKKMVVCGGGHVSIPVIQIGRMLGFHVSVLEDRPKFADNARRAGASEVFCEPFGEGLKRIEGDKDTFFIVVTRGHRYDQICLEMIAQKEYAYIGMIGSRKRAALVKQTAIEHGADRDVIQSVHTPIGLDIGAKTPEEIAVAIMAEVIQVKNEKSCGCFQKEILDAILDEKNIGEPKALATIIQRKGSAPREAGAKMLILPDGGCIGTIGGGCAESDILKKALLLLRGGETGIRICHVDMNGSDAEEEGMVCGGTIDVLLEIL